LARVSIEDATPAGPHYRLSARAFDRARTLHCFYLTAWVILPGEWHGIVAPQHVASFLPAKQPRPSDAATSSKGSIMLAAGAGETAG